MSDENVSLQCRLKVSLQYRSIKDDDTYGRGVGSGKDAGAVPNTYFPMRKGCNLHLYSDAHQVGSAFGVS